MSKLNYYEICDKLISVENFTNGINNNFYFILFKKKQVFVPHAIY